METKPHPEQGFRSCLGILSLGKKYSPERLEAASKRALHIKSYSYKSVKSILKHSLEKTALPGQKEVIPIIEHDNIRGEKIFYIKDQGGFFEMVHQTVEKLYQMRLEGMADAFTGQMEQPSSGALSFEERFAMIVDQEWTSRENRKLTRRLKAARLKLKATAEDIDYRHPRGPR